MRTLALCCVAIAALVLSSCQSEPEIPLGPGPRGPADAVFDSPGGPVRVLALSHDEDAGAIEAVLTVGNRMRYLTIGAHRNTAFPVGLAAELRDADGSLLFGLETAWDPESPGLLWLSEWTSNDMLTMTVRGEGDRVREEYTVRGRRFTAEYSRSELDPSQRYLARQTASEYTESPDGEADTMDLIGRFETFYRDNVGASLADNLDGEVLTSLLTDADFVGVGLGISYGWFSNLGEDADRICGYSLRCTTLKCRFGGWANPVCVACGGITSACVIATIACHFTDCGNTKEAKEGK